MVDYAKIAKITAQLVPLFSGEPSPHLSTELQTFLGCCRQAQQCLTAEEQPAFLQILPTRLRGDAYLLFASDVPTTFKAVEERLNRAYLPRETYQELVNKLITTRQIPLEALHAFTSRLKQLLALCQEAADTKYGATASPAVKAQLEDFAKNALKSGVNNPHLCQYLLTIGDEPLDNLIQKALDMERLQQSALHMLPTGAQMTYPTNQVQVSPLQGPTYPSPYAGVPPFFQQASPGAQPPTNQNPDNVRRPQNQASQPRNNQLVDRRQNRSPIGARIVCNFCQIRGHTYADCLKRKNTPYCVNCKVYGHDVRDCRRNRPNFNIGPTRGPPNRPNFNTVPQRGPLNRSPNRPPPQDQRNSNGPRVYNARLFCDFCGRRGHAVDNCAQKRKWEARNPGNVVQSTQNAPDRL